MYTTLSISRYEPFNSNGSQSSVPFIKLDSKGTDKRIVWKENESKLYNISAEYYSGNPTYGWLIMSANPEYTLEYDIPHNTIITIPYPLNVSIREYKEKCKNYQNNY